MMPHAEAVLREMSVLLTQVFFTGLWQGAAFALAVAAMLRVSPRAGEGTRYTALRVAFVLLATLPWIHFRGAAETGSGNGAGVHVLPVIATWIAVIWVGMAMLRAVQLLLAYRHLRAVWRRAVPFPGNGEDRSPLVSGRRQLELCTSADVDSPTVLGFRRPRFLLPEWLAPTLTDADLQQIALHECEHLRRRDDWMNLLQQVALVVLPLHPALLWLNGRMNVQRELACDAGVIARTAEPIAYASCLTRLAEQRLQRRSRLRLALAAWEHRSELARRVHALLNNGTAWTPAQSRIAATWMTLILAAGALVMARAPQLIQVAGADPAVVIAADTSIASHPELSRAASMQPVVFRIPENKFPSATSHKPRRDVAREMKNPAIVPVRAVRRRHSAVRPGLLLTAFPYRSPTPAAERPGRLATTEFTHAYAAVPFGDGWLLIQL